MSGANSSRLAAGDFPLGLKWTVASRTGLGAGATVSVSDTSAQSTRPCGGAQRICSSTTAWVALDGARYVPDTSTQPLASGSPSPGCSGSADPLYPFK